MLNNNHNYKLNIMYWLCIGYACRADKNPYRQDRRADKNPYRHDRRADKNPYRQDRRADKNPYRHDRRADKNPYRHDRRADSQCHIFMDTFPTETVNSFPQKQ